MLSYDVEKACKLMKEGSFAELETLLFLGDFTAGERALIAAALEMEERLATDQVLHLQYELARFQADNEALSKQFMRQDGC